MAITPTLRRSSYTPVPTVDRSHGAYAAKATVHKSVLHTPTPNSNQPDTLSPLLREFIDSCRELESYK